MRINDIIKFISNFLITITFCIKNNKKFYKCIPIYLIFQLCNQNLKIINNDSRIERLKIKTHG